MSAIFVMILDRELEDSILNELTLSYPYVSDKEERRFLSTVIRKLKWDEAKERLDRFNVKGYFYEICGPARFTKDL